MITDLYFGRSRMLPGETVLSGADTKCPDCGTDCGTTAFKVCHSNAGYYIGTMCECGPYSRESDYFRTKEAAQKALDEGDWIPRS
jgi:hypothetical protein